MTVKNQGFAEMLQKVARQTEERLAAELPLEVSEFLAEMCQTGFGLSVSASSLFEAYSDWGGTLTREAFNHAIKKRFMLRRVKKETRYLQVDIRWSSVWLSKHRRTMESICMPPFNVKPDFSMLHELALEIQRQRQAIREDPIDRLALKVADALKADPAFIERLSRPAE